MVNIICPNRNLDEWKALVDGIGEERAYLSFFRSKNQIPTVEAARQLLGIEAPKSAQPVPKPLTTLETLSQSKQVKIKLPEGANQLRITTSDGKRAIETIRNLNTGSNPFYGVQNITKVEAGVTGVSGANKGKFLPVKGEILVNPTASVSTEGESNEKPRLSPYMEADSGALAARASEFIRKVVGEAPRANVLFRHRTDGDLRAGAALDAIEKAFGRKILFMDFGPAARGVNGFIIPDIPSVIFLNTNAQSAPLVVVGHELFEHLKISNPELYEEIISAIGPTMTGLSEWHEMLSRAYSEKTKFTSPDISHSKKELVANFIGDSFADPDFWNRVQEKNPSLFQKVGRIVLDWLNSLLAKLKGFGSYRFFNDIQAAHDVIARGLEKFSETAVSGGATQEPTLSVAVESPTEPEGVEVQVGGQHIILPGVEKLTKAERDGGQQRAAKILSDLKIPGGADTKNVYTVTPDGFNYDHEGRQLIAEVKRLIGLQNVKGEDAAVVPMLVRAINYNLDAWEQVFSPKVADELRGISAGESSIAGQRLRMMQGQNTDDISNIARNMNFYLKRTYSQVFGGEAYESFLNRVLSEFGTSFTDEELAAIAADKPQQEALIKKLLTNAVKDQGGRVYLGAQRLLKPKSARKLSRMEADAKVAEAVQKIIEDAAKQGIAPPEKKGVKLSPLQKLLLMIQPKTVEKLNALIGQAVKDAERNAGIRAALNAAPDEKARNELEANFYAGEDPTPEQVEEGLNLQEFAHWRVIRDNILGYSPVTTSLAEQMIKSDFKGAFFKKAGQPKPQDLRINLFQLAKNPDAEVQRVTDNYINALQAAMNLSQSTPEIKQQVAELVRKKISDEIKARRQEFLDNFFTVRNSIPSTAVDKLKQLINAGVSKDPRFQSDRVRQLVKKMAAQYLKDTDFNSLATSTRAEKFNWLEQKYDEIYKAEHFDQLDEKTREYFEAVVRTQLAERIQAGEESVVRSFLTGADVNFVKTPVTSESRASSLNAAKSKLEGIIRAGAFDASMVDVLARKGPVQRLLPTISGIAKAIVQTPSFRLESAKRSVIDNLVNDLGIDPANADKVWAAFMEAYGLRFEQARQKAVDQAIKSMTPVEKKIIPRDDDRLWKVIEKFFRAGGDDVGELLKKVAVIRGVDRPDARGDRRT